MSKTIRVIDLLNKIANGEEVPYKVKYNGIIFTYNSSNKQGLKYVDLNKENEVFYRYLTGVVNKLTDEVEIIEEQEEIDIQKLDENIKYYNIIGYSENEKMLFNMIQDTANRINKLVQAVKQLKKELKELKEEMYNENDNL